MDLKNEINNYKNGKKYSKIVLEKFVIGYINKEIDDKLMTSFIKSIYDKELSIEETSLLTEIMLNSGKIINLNDIPGIKVDKHSTGGVGDKVSLIIGPIVASFGVKFAKMSGRGLGFTGGTLDKLESIPGYNILLTEEQFKKNIIKHSIAIISQTDDLVPADKKIYALRDVTNLIDSMPLIVSSIMSKKLATGSDAILLDVKCGDGSFMKNQKQAEKLAQWMINLGKNMKKDVRAEITSMQTPLGYAIGNKNEVLEAISFLKNEKCANDLKEVVYSSASTMLVQAKKFKNEEEAKKAIKENIISGKAFQKFIEWIVSQNGDVDKALSEDFWKPKYKLEIKANKNGFLNIEKAKTFGLVAMKLGAGREKKEDSIDFEAGIQLNKKSSDKIKKGDLLFTFYSSKKIPLSLQEEIDNAYTIISKPKQKKIILNKM